MTIDFAAAYVTATGKFLPGEPVTNQALDRFIAPLNARSERIKRRVLADNGIQTRHYAIDEQGRTRFSATEMAANAARACLEQSEIDLSEVSVLCTASSGGDLGMPGFANMVQGALAAGPMHTSSHQGVCASAMTALQHAASALAIGDHQHGLVVASELPSRMFKRSRFAPRDYHVDFDSHFLRWMLSDGAGACLLSQRPRQAGLSLRLDWIHTRSFSGDHPVCMQLGSSAGGADSYLDYPSLLEAEQAGAFLLRQDIRLLPRLFELGIHEYLTLIQRQRIEPDKVDHFLCHYSSGKFAPVVAGLMHKAGFSIDRDRWYSNLSWRGNTGAASIFIMLDDFMRERTLVPGQRVLCFVPESGRFTVSFAQLTVVGPQTTDVSQTIEAPYASGAAASAPVAKLIADLASVWQDYQSRLRRTPLLSKIADGRVTAKDYLAWMSDFIPQVRQGSQWMRTAQAQLSGPYTTLAPLIAAHADDERNDYALLFEDYVASGGQAASVDVLQRNPGGEALNAFMFRLAEQSNPVALLGAIYIIEGTGKRVIPSLLPLLRRALALPERCFRFLRYHGDNDQAHLARWLQAVEMVVAHDPDAQQMRAITRAARATSELYLLQFTYVAVAAE